MADKLGLNPRITCPPGNPQGGYMKGTRMTDTEYSVGKGVEVSNASFVPGYEFGNSIDGDGEAALMKGFSRNPECTGE